MDPDRYARVKALFEEAQLLEPQKREAFLQSECGSDTSLRDEVQELLACVEPVAGDVLDMALDPRTRNSEERSPRLPVEGPGTVLGKYTILEPIGEGGFGTVFRAQQDRPVRRDVALKIIKLGMDTRQVVARFEAERQALALMEHPSIAQIYDAGATELGRPYFAMELVTGVPITTFCDRDSLSTPARLELFRQVCLAVQHAHQKGILHRDLKPSNILVTRVDGKPLAKVIDFGIAKATRGPLTESSMATEAHQIMGTPEYMPPEQASGAEVDTRADVYSLGVVLYELLTGTRPFARETTGLNDLSALLRAINEETPPKPSTRASELGAELTPLAQRHGVQPSSFARSLRGDLDWIVLKALEKDPERRYPTAAALADDLENHLHDLPVDAGPPSTLYRAGKLVRRNRPLVAAGSVVALTILIGIAALAWGFVTVREERDSADLARKQESEARAEAVRAQQEEAEARAAAEDARGAERKQRERAETALVEAKEVVDFLSTALEAVQPEFLGHDVPMRAVLDQAAQRIGDRFDQLPAVEARLRHVIGNSYAGLGRHNDAEEHLRRTVELYRQAETLDPERRFQAQRDLAILYTRLDRPDDALPLLERVLEEANREDQEALGEAFEAWNNIAVLYFSGSRYAEAAALWEEQMEVASTLPGFEEERAIAAGNLAMAYEDLGRYHEALTLYEEAYAFRVRDTGLEHPETLSVLNNITSALTSLGRYDEAEERILELIEVRERVLGPDHPDTTGSVFNLALVYQRTGRFEEAAEMTLRVLGVEQRLFGLAHRWTLATMNQLGVIYNDLERFEDAEEVLGEAMLTAEQTFGAEDSSALSSKQNLAFALWGLGDPREALQMYEEVLAIRLRIEGPATRNVASLQRNMGDLLHELGRSDEGLELLQQALDARIDSVGADHPDVATIRESLDAITADLGVGGEQETE